MQSSLRSVRIRIKDPETEIITYWWLWPYADVDNSRLKVGMSELPVMARSNFFYNSKNIAFQLDPDDTTKMLVLRLGHLENSYVNSKLVYHRHTRYFQVSVGTPLLVVQILMDLLEHRNSQLEKRIRLDYGDVNTLRSWEEEHDVEGYVGTTTGKKRAFILVHNKRSSGGVCIFTDSILSIRTTKSTSKQKPSVYHYLYELNEMFTNSLKEVKARSG